MLQRPAFCASARTPLRPQPSGAVVWGSSLLAAMIAALAFLQAAPAAAQPGAPAAPAEANAKPAVPSKPLWASLSADQQAALKPLASQWDTISGFQKSKWLAISRNFESMKPEDQATLHSRMSEWAALSAQGPSPRRRTQSTEGPDRSTSRSFAPMQEYVPTRP